MGFGNLTCSHFLIFLCIQFALNQHSHAEHLSKSYLFVYTYIVADVNRDDSWVSRTFTFTQHRDVLLLFATMKECLPSMAVNSSRKNWKKSSEQIWIEKPKALIQRSYICITSIPDLLLDDMNLFVFAFRWFLSTVQKKNQINRSTKHFCLQKYFQYSLRIGKNLSTLKLIQRTCARE